MTTVTTTATVDPLGLDAALGDVGIIVRDYGDHRFIDAPVDEATILAAVASHTPADPEATVEQKVAAIEKALLTKGTLTAKDITDAVAAVDEVVVKP